MKFAFFGTGPLADSALNTLQEKGLLPSLIVTKKDAPVGRKQIITPPNTKLFGEQFGIPVFQPDTLKDLIDSPLHTDNFDFFVVASYGKIIPQSILDLPKLGTLNIHPSKLPLYRGPTPIESALLAGDTSLWLSLMVLDADMDHGPIIEQKEFLKIEDNERITAEEVEAIAGREGALLLAPYLSGKELTSVGQHHDEATFTKKFTKEHGKVSLDMPLQDIAKVYRATTPWPGCYFMHQHAGAEIRVKIVEMSYTNGEYAITRVVPEGRKEMSYADFQRGFAVHN
jgi:methionyl-tRNA formyltransferase